MRGPVASGSQSSHPERCQNQTLGTHAAHWVAGCDFEERTFGELLELPHQLRAERRKIEVRLAVRLRRLTRGVRKDPAGSAVTLVVRLTNIAQPRSHQTGHGE